MINTTLIELDVDTYRTWGTRLCLHLSGYPNGPYKFTTAFNLGSNDVRFCLSKDMDTWLHLSIFTSCKIVSTLCVFHYIRFYWRDMSGYSFCLKVINMSMFYNIPSLVTMCLNAITLKNLSLYSSSTLLTDSQALYCSRMHFLLPIFSVLNCHLFFPLRLRISRTNNSSSFEVGCSLS